MLFTDAQQAAVAADNRELLVSAAAGSGKTRVLIERIFRMLESGGFSLDRLLIVTFTHAAAAEMRERLQARLAEAAGDDPRMRRQAELLESAQISTLHSFCQKLLREYFQEVDIDPQASLADETVAAALHAEAKEDALDDLYERAAAGDADAASLTRKFEEAQIDRMLAELYPFLMGLPDPFGWLDAQASKTYAPDDLAHGAMAEALLSDCRLLAQGVSEAAARCQTLEGHPSMDEKYRPAIRSDVQAADALLAAAQAGLSQAGDAARAFSLMRLPAVRGLEGTQAALRDEYKALRERMKGLAKTIAQRVPADLPAAIARLNAMQPALRALGVLARELDARYAALKRGRALLDFHDLERMALRILANPAIREEVAARFDGVFVDEYQDISAVQEAILNAVKRDVSRETISPAQRFFYVGDVKQSIYRFRQADPSLFMQKAKAFSPALGAPERRITLNANFRSRERVLAAVNRVFGRVMRADVTEIAYDADARLYAGTPSQMDPPVSLHLFTQPVRAADRVALQAQAIAREIRRRVGRQTFGRDSQPGEALHYRDIAILGPKMKAVSTVLERVLTEHGIPVYCEDRASALESEEIAQTLNHLRLLDNIADDLSLIAWLRSPAGGFGERMLAEVRLRVPDGPYLAAVQAVAQADDPLGRMCAAALHTLGHERFLMMETPLDRYLWGWLTRSGLYAFFGCQPGGAQRQANLRMLCEKAGEHVKRRGGELSDFLRSVEAQTGVRDNSTPTVLSPWEDVVRVMTIHKSKGLEFPVVFVMGLEEGFGGGGARGALLSLHPRLGVALPYVNEAVRTTSDTLLKGAIDLRLQSEHRAERARLLYVAMTRARDELVLLGCSDQLAPGDAAAGFPQNGPPTAYAVSGAGSMLDWVCQCVEAGDDAEGAEDGAEQDGAERDSTAWADSGAAFAQAATAQNSAMRTESAPTQNSSTHAQTAPAQNSASHAQTAHTQNGEPWNTAPADAFSTVSTLFPQKNDGWRLVFHVGGAEVAAARKAGRGRAALTDAQVRKARLDALAADARALAARRGYAQPAPEPRLSGMGDADGVPPDAAILRDALTGTGEALRDTFAGGKVASSDTLAGTGEALRDTFAGAKAASPSALPDPVAPSLTFTHRPFKLGATALARAEQRAPHAAAEPPALLDADAGDPAAQEAAALKRLPLPLTRPRLMADLPAMPAFMRPPAEQTGVRRGVATHLALSLLDFSPLRGLADGDLPGEVRRQLAEMVRRRLMPEADAALVEPASLARFLCSPHGREALAAETVHREWSFNLRLPERGGLIVQGVIDLCTLTTDGWALVDYKTDRVSAAAELWQLYGGQMALYRRALTEATGQPVRDVTLYSLALGQGDTRA